MLRAWRIGLVLASAWIVGCSSNDGADGSSDDPLEGTGREAYVAAFGAGDAAGAPVVEDEDERRACVVEAVVDGVGVEVLRDVVTPREVADAATDGGTALAGLGVELDGGRVDAVVEGVEECGDLGELFVGEMATLGGGELPGPAMECFEGKLDDDLLREIVVTRLVEGDAAFAEKPGDHDPADGDGPLLR